jgi:hypothetical protein
MAEFHQPDRRAPIRGGVRIPKSGAWCGLLDVRCASMMTKFRIALK